MSEPVGTISMASMVRSPIRMTEPLPNCFSICERAEARALRLLSSIVVSSNGVIVSGCSLPLARLTE